MTPKEVTHQIAIRAVMEIYDVAEVLEVLSSVIVEGLSEKKEVKVKGLGTFYLAPRKESRRKNPKTQEWVTVKSKQVLKFRPSKKLSNVEDLMEKYGAELDESKVKEASADKKGTPCPICGKECGESKVCPEHGQEGFEKRPEND